MTGRQDTSARLESGLSSRNLLIKKRRDVYFKTGRRFRM
jgi:hypothetical protein